jgi:hypothetical protein
MVYYVFSLSSIFLPHSDFVLMTMKINDYEDCLILIFFCLILIFLPHFLPHSDFFASFFACTQKFDDICQLGQKINDYEDCLKKINEQMDETQQELLMLQGYLSLSLSLNLSLSLSLSISLSLSLSSTILTVIN